LVSTSLKRCWCRLRGHVRPRDRLRQSRPGRLALPGGPFDLAYSSLTFHYIADLSGLFAEIYRALAPDGCLVFSIEHPIYMTPSRPQWDRPRGPRGLAARRLSRRRQGVVKLDLGPRLRGLSHEGFLAPAAVRARAHERTGCCDVPDIICPDIDAGLPTISTVKFDDPSFRTAVTTTRAVPPVRVPAKTTES
jgi:SAM-dependent methyltransferase